MDSSREPAVLSRGDREWIPIQDRQPLPGQIVLYQTEFYQAIGTVNDRAEFMLAANRREFLPVVCWSVLP